MEFVFARILVGEGFGTLEIRIEGRVVEEGRRVRRLGGIVAIGGMRRAGQHGERGERDRESSHVPTPLTRPAYTKIVRYAPTRRETSGRRRSSAVVIHDRASAAVITMAALMPPENGWLSSAYCTAATKA